MNPQRIALAAAVCAAAVLGLTACTDDKKDASDGKASASSSEKSAAPEKSAQAASDPFAGLTGAQVMTKAAEASRKAGSLTMDLDIKFSDGPAKGTISLDGKTRCSGELAVEKQGSIDLVKVGKAVYMRPDEAFLRAQSEGEPKSEVDATIKLMKGKWLKGTTSDPDLKEFAGLCDVDEFLAPDGDSADDSLRKGPVTEIDGVKALQLTGKDEDGAPYEVYVAAEGRPYVLKVEKKSGEEPGTVVFRDYGKAVEVTSPPASEVLDFS
ncbi:hypothetical protein AB0M28_28960 [Streptomyces sp. NPDC051940]|uniref:hypothetical protein n=1 Tax=Streptomyces sp. NPDC051940 TaxID=3155675 RepID=UPI003443CE88